MSETFYTAGINGMSDIGTRDWDGEVLAVEYDDPASLFIREAETPLNDADDDLGFTANVENLR